MQFSGVMLRIYSCPLPAVSTHSFRRSLTLSLRAAVWNVSCRTPDFDFQLELFYLLPIALLRSAVDDGMGVDRHRSAAIGGAGAGGTHLQDAAGLAQAGRDLPGCNRERG